MSRRSGPAIARSSYLVRRKGGGGRRSGEKADTAKPLRGLGPGVFEIALAHRGDAFRTVDAVPLGEDVWVVHAFEKKAKTGIGTPRREIDLVRERIGRLKEHRR